MSLNLKRDNQFCFFAIQDAEDKEDDDDKKKDKDKDKKKDGKDGKGLAHYMFSRFLNLRICLTKIYFYNFCCMFLNPNIFFQFEI